MKNYIFIALLTLFINKCYSQEAWEITYGNVNYFGQSDVSFISPNVGYAVGYTNSVVRLMKTNNKGINWSLVSEFQSDYYWCKNSSISFKSENVGYVSYDDKIVKFNNGVINTVLTFPTKSSWHRLRFANDSIGYAVFNRVHDGAAYQTNVSIYKTTNGGNSWFLTSASNIQTQSGLDKYSQLRDLDISSSDANIVHAVGFYVNGALGTSLHVYTSNGFISRTVGGDAVSGSKFGHVSISQNNEVRILGNYGLKTFNIGVTTYTQRYDFGNQTSVPEFGMDFINNNVGYVCVQTGKIMKTTNGGNNWTLEVNCGVSTNINVSSTLLCIGDVVYYADATNKNIFTRNLSTNFQTSFDNQSTPSSIFFDGTQYASPSSQYLRGGYSSLSCSNIIDPGQTNEKIFYKWSDNFMYADHRIGYSNGMDYYFDMSGTTIANYYKTKQLSTNSTAISNSSQTKSIRDTTINSVTATHTIHESMGGIFYSKSTNFGATYQTEEVVNLSEKGTSDGNKNAYITIMRNFAGQNPITAIDENRNVGVVWEKYNSATGKVEIKFAHRALNTAQNGYEWIPFVDNNGNEYITSFTAPSGFESKPKCFVAVSPGYTQSGPYVIIVPHLRPNGSQNKVFTSVRYNSQSQDYELDNGNIQDLSVSSPYNSYSSYHVHFSYIKDNKVAYRNEEFGYYNGNIYRASNPEVNNNISSGDGYASRFTPDISLMNNIPVVSYAASYDANAWVEYENGGGTDIIPLHYYPIVKVQRTGNNIWGNYAVYNSTNYQSSPDIEGSSNANSYIINYLQGGLFKKVAGLPAGYRGYYCNPNSFSGTDSRLIANSYSGIFGNNLSMLTLSPQSNIYKVDKQSFVITNLSAIDSYADELNGVVNLDTIKYSINLGPILIQENNNSIKQVTFGKAIEETDPIITPVEFNENLRSNTFLLNESQALLIGCNVTYVKDNSDAPVNNVKYNLNLMNKTTGLLHRVLYQDTIHIEDSIATEFLKGFHITNIPNGEDSFYVQIKISNNDIANGIYNINPAYNDDEIFGDNSSGYKTKVIFENTNVRNTTKIIPSEYSLNQNYPNPFNPSTMISYSIPYNGFVKIKIFDITGREIQTLVNEIKQAGNYNLNFDGSNLSSGIYFYRIETGKFTQTRRMTLIK